MRRALQLALCGICVLCGFAGELRAQPLTLPFASRETGLLVEVEISAPSARPSSWRAVKVVLLLDTGAAFTHLDARYLKLPRSKRALEVATGSGSAELRILEPVKLELRSQNSEVRKTFDIETLDVDLAAQRKQCGCEVAGVLGLDVLRRFARVTFDFQARELRLVQEAR